MCADSEGFDKIPVGFNPHRCMGVSLAAARDSELMERRPHALASRNWARTAPTRPRVRSAKVPTAFVRDGGSPVLAPLRVAGAELLSVPDAGRDEREQVGLGTLTQVQRLRVAAVHGEAEFAVLDRAASVVRRRSYACPRHRPRGVSRRHVIRELVPTALSARAAPQRRDRIGQEPASRAWDRRYTLAQDRSHSPVASSVDHNRLA